MVGKLKVLALLEALPGCRQGQGPAHDGRHRHRRDTPGAGPRCTTAASCSTSSTLALRARSSASTAVLDRSRRPVMSRRSLTIVWSGAGGAGKGTIARRLVGRRSGTVVVALVDDACAAGRRRSRRLPLRRPRRFVHHRDRGGFLGMERVPRQPLRHAAARPARRARCVARDRRERRAPGAPTVIPTRCCSSSTRPSVEEQRRRLLGRGDSPEQAEARIARGRPRAPRREGARLPFVINDDLDRAVAEIRAAIDAGRSACARKSEPEAHDSEGPGLSESGSVATGRFRQLPRVSRCEQECSMAERTDMMTQPADRGAPRPRRSRSSAW